MYGSKHSLFPKICEVDAVGIGATNNEFLTPFFFISFLSLAQSHLPLKSSSLTPHILCWNSPLEIGEPLYDLYVPSLWASSIDAVKAA